MAPETGNWVLLASPNPRWRKEMAKTTSGAQTNSDLPDGLSAPAQRALAGAGISRLAQLAKMTEADVKALHGIGPNALGKLRAAMEVKGLRFKGEEK